MFSVMGDMDKNEMFLIDNETQKEYEVKMLGCVNDMIGRNRDVLQDVIHAFERFCVGDWGYDNYEEREFTCKQMDKEYKKKDNLIRGVYETAEEHVNIMLIFFMGYVLLYTEEDAENFMEKYKEIDKILHSKK